MPGAVAGGALAGAAAGAVASDGLGGRVLVSVSAVDGAAGPAYLSG